MSPKVTPYPEDNVRDELKAVGNAIFEVMQTIVDGECRNKAIGHCEEAVKHLKKLEDLLRD